MNEWKCRECNTPVTGVAHLRLGRQMARGSNALCLTCCDKEMARRNIRTIHDLVPAYVRANSERSETAELRDRVRQLEQILSDPRALEVALERATTPNQGRRVS